MPTTPPAAGSRNTPLLMGCSLPALRRKLTRRGSPLAPWWQHFVTQARRDPDFFSPYTVLTALVTEEPGDRELARRAFLRFVEFQAEGRISQDAQFHTHVIAAPLARWAIFYDWVADSGILSPADDQAFRDYLLDYALVFPWQHAVSRARQFDNQLMSNAFASAVVGYILGLRRGDSPAARRLFRCGLEVLQPLLNMIPPGGYSGEGSTYHEHVVLPLTLLSSLFVEEVTGTPVPGLQLLLETSCRMIGPDGLLPPWDAYGYEPATMKVGLAYLARLTRDPNPLAIVRERNLWYRVPHPAWEMDDRLWTLVFWPEDVDTGAAAAAYPPWMETDIAGALQAKASRLRLFQYWDECGGVPTSGRCQVDPNAVAFEAFGSPILMDGHGYPVPDPITIPEAAATAYVGRRTLESVQEYIFSSWNAHITDAEALRNALSGSIGLANSIVLDQEYWYVPLGPRRGTGQALHAVGPLQALRSDATAYYRDRYDVASITRSSLLVDGRYVLVTDRVRSATPHLLTWQAYVRQEASAADGRVILTTPEQVRCDIVPVQPGQLELTPVTAYPKLGDNRSALLRHTLPATADGRVDVLLAPQPAAVPLQDLSDGWFRGPATEESAAPTVDLRKAYLTDDAPAAATRDFHRTFRLRPAPGRRYFLRLRASGPPLEVQVNDSLVPAIIAQDKGHWRGSAEHLPIVCEITAALRAGSNTIALRAPFFHGESVLGPVELLGEATPAPVAVQALGGGAFRIDTGAGQDAVLSDNDAGVVVWAGGSTDARYAVLTAAGSVAAAAVTRLELPERVAVAADAPCDLAWTAGQTHLARWVEGSTVRVAWAGCELRIQTGGSLDIAYLGAAPHRLVLDLRAPQAIFVNGRRLGMRQGMGTTLTLASAGEPAAALKDTPAVDAVYGLMQQPRGVAAQTVIDHLRGTDWRLQVAAADVAGLLQLTEAVPVLLECFAAGENELPYPALKTWWRASKMLRSPHSVEGDDPSVPRPLGEKRWRVRRAVVSALGKIGDARAVAPLEEAMRRCTDFFPVTSQLAVALGRLGASSSVAVLERHRQHAEMNTRLNARHALALLAGEITRAEFERRVGLG